jgi:FlgD Ig-like domain
MNKMSRVVTNRVAFSIVFLTIGATPGVTMADAASVPDPSGSAELSVARPSPNHAQRSLTLSYALPSSAAVRLAIHDVTGRQVRELVSGTQSAGTHEVPWDLRDESGQPVPGGIHFAQLEAEVRTLPRKLTIQ